MTQINNTYLKSNLRSRVLLLSFYFTLLSGYCLGQGSIMLVGGGSENYGDWSDKPYKWFVEHAPNRKILVLHYSTTSTFFTGYFPSLSNCTVSNLAITNTTQANDSSTYKFILQHDGIFLRGGDQEQYYNVWRNTLTQKAITEVFQRGGVIGGTSAGEMVLSEVNYLGGSSDNGALIRNSTSSINLVDEFLPFVYKSLAESHTNERGRIGRLPAFLARYKESKGKEITGIALDVNTALVIDKNGMAEVMGGVGAGFLRWTNETQYQINPGNPFSLKKMKYDLLLPGSMINLNNYEITKSTTVVSYSPKSVSTPKARIILDGSGNSNDWMATNGSLLHLKAFLQNSKDTVGIFTSNQQSINLTSLTNFLNQSLINSRLLVLNTQSKNDLLFISKVKSCKAFIFIENIQDSASSYFDTNLSLGKEFIAKLNIDLPILFLGDDVMLAGIKTIKGIYSSYSAYYGTLTFANGLNILNGIQPIPRFYQNRDNTRGYDETENRIMGAYWVMGKFQTPLGFLIDSGTRVVFQNGEYEVFGTTTTATPVIVVDARSSSFVDYPIFKRPGRPNSVQTAAFINASLSIVPPGENIKLTSIRSYHRNNTGDSFSLNQNYPNPFNASTIFNYQIPKTGFVDFKVYDSIGREIDVLIEGEQSLGNYQVTWNSNGVSSGIYFARMKYQSENSIQIQTKKIVMIK